MKIIITGIFSLIICIIAQSQECLVGTSMDFALYLQNSCGIVYSEDDLPKNPFQSIKDHGGSIIRLRIDLPPYVNNYITNEPPVDYRSPERVKEGMQAAQQAGLKTLLTFSYQSFALDANEMLNPYVAPLVWQSIAGDLNKLTDSVHDYTYNNLADLIDAGLVPEIVSIGNETNWRILEPNVPEGNLPAYSPQRVVNLLNAGTSAVREINLAYNLNIKIALHIADASALTWWMNTHLPLGLDFDIMGLSHYHAWHSLGNFNSWAEVVNWVQLNYQKDFIILETAQLFSSGYSDNHPNVLGTENIPAGYPNPPTTQTQREYLKDLTNEILQAGGLGTIAWGGDWVGSDCYVYPDQYGPGSSFENKAFWDFNNNLHDGINWMKDCCPNNSIGDITQESDLKIYPIPMYSNSLTIESKNIVLGRVEVFTILGEKINSVDFDQEKHGKVTFELSNQKLSAGNYILKIFDCQNRFWIQKIPIIQKIH
jgi:arabinogalactan endo-1,4-beta-galactosidase